MGLKKFLHKNKYIYIYTGSFKRRAADYRMDIPQQFRADYLKNARKAYLKYGLLPNEYAKYRFYEKNEEEKSEYLSYKDEVKIFHRSSLNLFPRHKFKRYQMFSTFFHRDVLFVSSDKEGGATDAEYRDFCERNKSFIVKPIKGYEGKGIHIITEAPETIKELLNGEYDELLLEGLISQGEQFKAFHPSSVNTVRFVSIMNADGQYFPLYVLIRVGIGGSVVDNVGAGGLVALVDINSGIVSTDALCGAKYYEKHPDTGVRFKGFEIPKWKELCELVERAHKSFSQQRLIGWDFAWTEDNEWEMVEANPTPSFISYQTLSGRGIRPVLNERGIRW